MTILKHELRQGIVSFGVWTGVIVFLLAMCLFLFPEMKGEMGAMGEAFSSMGSFTAAFGMDRLNFGTLIGFYAIECGNILGLGGAFFALMSAITVISKEERGRTAEFLLAHPIKRGRVVIEKLEAVLIQITAMNMIALVLALTVIGLIGEEIPWKGLLMIHLAYFLMQVELAGICFGISAFFYRGNAGVGLGLAALMYGLNLVANLSERVGFLKHITPFGYCDGADIIMNDALDIPYILLGLCFGAVVTVAGIWYYNKKDIH